MKSLTKTINALVRQTRSTGMTSAIAIAARHTKGIVVCHSAGAARWVAETHLADTTSIDNLERMAGLPDRDMYVDGEVFVVLALAVSDMVRRKNALESALRNIINQGDQLSHHIALNAVEDYGMRKDE